MKFNPAMFLKDISVIKWVYPKNEKVNLTFQYQLM